MGAMETAKIKDHAGMAIWKQMAGSIKPFDTTVIAVIILVAAACYPLIKLGLPHSPPLRFGGLRTLIACLLVSSCWLSVWLDMMLSLSARKLF